MIKQVLCALALFGAANVAWAQDGLSGIYSWKFHADTRVNEGPDPVNVSDPGNGVLFFDLTGGISLPGPQESVVSVHVVGVAALRPRTFGALAVLEGHTNPYSPPVQPTPRIVHSNAMAGVSLTDTITVGGALAADKLVHVSLRPPVLHGDLYAPIAPGGSLGGARVLLTMQVEHLPTPGTLAQVFTPFSFERVVGGATGVERWNASSLTPADALAGQFDLTPGESYRFRINFATNVSFVPGQLPPSAPAPDRSHALFDNTVTWNGLELSVDGQAAPGITLQSGVGFDWVSAAEVPEPATTALWLAGLAAVAWMRHRRTLPAAC